MCVCVCVWVCYNIILLCIQMHLFLITIIYYCCYNFLCRFYIGAQWLNDGKHNDEISKGVVVNYNQCNDRVTRRVTSTLLPDDANIIPCTNNINNIYYALHFISCKIMLLGISIMIRIKIVLDLSSSSARDWIVICTSQSWFEANNAPKGFARNQIDL